MKRLTYLDLFAGCGGLSSGFKQAGFELALAVEKSPMAGRTYCYNFISQKAEDEAWWNDYIQRPAEEQVADRLLIGNVEQLAGNSELLERFAGIDLIAGGPPCQGFSLAGKREKDDPRNSLAWSFLSIVEQVKPKLVLIENVVGINRSFEKGELPVFVQLRKQLDAIGYNTNGFEVNAKHFGVPQSRPRMLIVGYRKDLFPTAGSPETEIKKDSSLLSLIGEASKLISCGDAIGTVATGTQNHNIRKHSQKVKNKFRAFCWIAEQGLDKKIPQKLASGSISVDSITSATTYPVILKNGEVLAENREQLEQVLLDCATKKTMQKVLDFAQPAPTILGSGPDDYIHPTECRGLSVREFARLQSFDDTFVFLGKEQTGGLARRVEVPQFTQVGNAVPPKLALAIAKHLGTV